MTTERAIDVLANGIVEGDGYDWKEVQSARELAIFAICYLPGDKHTMELYRKSLETFSADAQTLMAMEEMAELQKELCKNARGKDNTDDIAQEIADVQIMIEQMMVLHNCAEQTALWKQQKLLRLKNLIAEAEGESHDKD